MQRGSERSAFGLQHGRMLYGYATHECRGRRRGMLIVGLRGRANKGTSSIIACQLNVVDVQLCCRLMMEHKEQHHVGWQALGAELHPGSKIQCWRGHGVQRLVSAGGVVGCRRCCRKGHLVRPRACAQIARSKCCVFKNFRKRNGGCVWMCVDVCVRRWCSCGVAQQLA